MQVHLTVLQPSRWSRNTSTKSYVFLILWPKHQPQGESSATLSDTACVFLARPHHCTQLPKKKKHRIYGHKWQRNSSETLGPCRGGTACLYKQQWWLFGAGVVGGLHTIQSELAFPAVNEWFLPTAHLASARNSLADTRLLAKDSVD